MIAAVGADPVTTVRNINFGPIAPDSDDDGGDDDDDASDGDDDDNDERPNFKRFRA